MSPDRTVHASFPGSAEVVRYDREGRWYLEGVGKRRRLTIREAVETAMDIELRGGTIHTGRPGGGQFDAKVEGARAKR